MPENVDPGMDQGIPQAPVAGTQNQNGAAHDGEDAGGESDAAMLKAELDKAKKQLGQLLNDKKKWAKYEEREKDVVALKDKLSGWLEIQDEFGVEPGQMKEQLKARSEAEIGEAKSKGEIDKLLENQAGKFKRDLEKKQLELQQAMDMILARNSVIDEITIDRQLRDELNRICDPLLVNGAFALHRGKAKSVEDTEAPHGIRVVMRVGGEDMPVADYLKQWAEADPEAQPYLIGNRSQGGGAPPGGRAGGPRMQRRNMNPKQKSEYMGKHGVDAYNALPW